MGKHLDFKCTLITGGGGGIGRGLAEYFVSQGKEVIIAGRTQSNLESTVASLSSKGKISYYVLDITKIESILPFIETVTRAHPELDCLINDAGVQRIVDVNTMSPADFLQRMDNEVNTNVRGPLHLTIHLLEHLKCKPTATIINFASVFGATKAYVRFWTMILREQLRLSSDGRHVRIIELAPPTVATDIHRKRQDPDDNKPWKNSDALTVDEFIDQVIAQIEQGKDVVGAGPSKAVVQRWWNEFEADFAKSVADGVDDFQKFHI